MSLFGADEQKNTNKEAAFIKNMEALVIGELSLSVRLLSLSASLSIASAVEPDAITTLTDNISSTLADTDIIIKTNKLDNSLAALSEYISDCSKTIGTYSKNKSYKNLTEMRLCIDNSIDKLDIVSNKFNKESKQDNK